MLDNADKAVNKRAINANVNRDNWSQNDWNIYIALISQVGLSINSRLIFFFWGGLRRIRIDELSRGIRLYSFRETQTRWNTGMKRKDKGNELETGAVRGTRVLQADQTKMRSVREPRHTKTTCLMVSLVRKKGKYETAHGGERSFLW